MFFRGGPNWALHAQSEETHPFSRRPDRLLHTMPALLAALALASTTTAALPDGFAPGWNNQALTPPMAWRSWNAFLADIDDKLIKANIGAHFSTIHRLFPFGFYVLSGIFCISSDLRGL